MNKSDLILEFIDGTLDAGREQRLFEQMAGHPELRAELRQYVMIGDAVRADREAYMPPADVERRLLGGLGVLPFTGAGTAGAAASGAVAGAGAASGASTSFAVAILAKLKSVLVPMLVGVAVGGLLAGGGVYFSMSASGDSGNNANLAAVKDEPVPSSTGSSGLSSIETAKKEGLAANGGLSADGAASGQDRLGAATSSSTGASSRMFQGSGSNGNSSAHTLSGRMDDPEAHNPTSPDNITTKDSKDVPQNNLNSSSSELSIIDRADSVLYTTTPKPVQVVSPEEVQNSVKSDQENSASRSPSSKLPELPAQTFEGSAVQAQPFAVELRKALTSGPFVDNNARQVQGGFISTEDLVVGAYFSPSSRYYVGAEYGRERFTQKLFYNQDDTLFIEQRPMINWGSVALGMNLQAFNVPFFVQGNVGASQYGGPLVRGRVGLDLMDLFGQRSSAFSVPLSVETSSLVYRYNEQYLVTGNWGVNAGARFRFGL